MAPSEKILIKSRFGYFGRSASMSTLFVLGILLMLVLLMLTACQSSSEAQVLFVSNRDGDTEIFTMNINGSGIKQLTKNTSEDTDAVGSPDGQKIAFTSTRDGNLEIYVMNRDGSDQMRITDHPQSDYAPQWSPDSIKIAFISTREGYTELYVVNADGTGIAHLTDTPEEGEELPIWSPDGSSIAYLQSSLKASDIRLVTPDGAQNITTTTTSYTESGVSWSSDSKKLLFHSDKDRYFNIFTINPDGSNLKQITSNISGHSSSPVWSPDETKILFASTRNGDRQQLYLMNADGSGQTRLTDSPTEDFQAIWWADGARIIFVRIENANSDIYVMNADGTNLKRLTKDPLVDSKPTVLPPVAVVK